MEGFAGNDLTVMNISKGKDIVKSVFFLLIKAATGNGTIRVSKGTKEHVPNWQVGKILSVMFVHVVHAMRFRTLKQVG